MKQEVEEKRVKNRGQKRSLIQHGELSRRQFLTGSAVIGTSLALQGSGLFSRLAWGQTKPLKIGVMEPFSGVYASLGKHALQGIEAVCEQYDWKVAGRPIELIKEDDENNPQVGLRKARKLVEQDKVDALMGIVSSATVYPLKQYCNEAKIIWIGLACAANDGFRKANNSPYAFRASHSTWQISRPPGDWLAKKGYKKVFIIGPDYAMGHDMTISFKEGWLDAGGSAPVGVLYAPLGTTDYAPYLAKIKQVEPDVVYGSFAGTDAVRFVKQFDEFGLKKNIKLTGMGYMVEEDTTDAQGDSAVGVITSVLSCWGLEIPENNRFKEAIKKRYNTQPTVDEYSAACGAMALLEAVKKVGGNTSDQLALCKALEQVNFISPRGPFRFDPDTHNVIGNVYIRESKKVKGEIHNYVVATYENQTHPHVAREGITSR